MSDPSNPFAPPQATEPQQIGRSSPSKGAYPFRSGSDRARNAKILIALVMIGCAFSSYAHLTRAAAIDAFRSSGNLMALVAPIEHGDNLIMTTVGLTAVAQLISAIMFLMWMHRVYRNLPALGATRLSMSPGWAVGYWFIPFVNLFKPYRAMHETWQHSDPKAGFSRMASPATLVGVWWAGFIIVEIIDRVGSKMIQMASREDAHSLHAVNKQLDSIMAGDSVLFIAALGTVVLGFITIAMITAIDRNQAERSSQIPKTAPQASQGPQFNFDSLPQ